jgi:hypothetical protein
LNTLHPPAWKLKSVQLCSAAQIRDKIILSVAVQLLTQSKTIIASSYLNTKNVAIESNKTPVMAF